MKWTVLSGLALLVLPVSAQTIAYDWLNQPCASLLSCDTGCSACNSARITDTWFTGTDVAWLGVEVCPHPIDVADNALMTYGWPSIPDEDHAVLVSGIAFTPVHVDSLIFRHRSGPDGPQRLRVRFGVNESLSTNEIADLPVPGEWGNTVFTDVGTVAAEGEMLYGFFSLLLQPYFGQGGAWELDGIRIVGSVATSTTVPDLSLPTNTARLPKYDASGRAIIERPGLRFYLDRTKQVVLR